MYPDLKNHDAMAVKFEIRMKVLESNLEYAMKLAEEILNSSDLHDTKRLAELIAQVKSRLQVNLSSSGHTVAQCVHFLTNLFMHFIMMRQLVLHTIR